MNVTHPPRYCLKGLSRIYVSRRYVTIYRNDYINNVFVLPQLHCHNDPRFRFTVISGDWRVSHGLRDYKD